MLPHSLSESIRSEPTSIAFFYMLYYMISGMKHESFTYLKWSRIAMERVSGTQARI